MDARQPRQLPTANGEFSKRALFRSDNIRAQWLAALIGEGYQDQIVLSHDLNGAQVPLNPETHGQRGYTYLWTTFTQILLDHGGTTLRALPSVHRWIRLQQAASDDGGAG